MGDAVQQQQQQQHQQQQQQQQVTCERPRPPRVRRVWQGRLIRCFNPNTNGTDSSRTCEKMLGEFGAELRQESDLANRD